jgi:hypothetical protein
MKTAQMFFITTGADHADTFRPTRADGSLKDNTYFYPVERRYCERLIWMRHFTQ